MKPKHIAAIVILAIVVVVAVALLYPQQPPTKPLTVETDFYMPLILKSHPIGLASQADQRFGVNEYDAVQVNVLGLPDDGRFHAQQWRAQNAGNTVIYLRTAHRSHAASRWCLGAYRFAGHWDYCAGEKATTSGWVDEAGLCAWMGQHAGRAYIVGNELACSDPVGDGITPREYAHWYAAAVELVRRCDPTAMIGPYGPVFDVNISDEQGVQALLAETWFIYRQLTGGPLPADFYPLHFYADPGFVLSEEIAKLEVWAGWFEAHRGREWTGPKRYWLGEYGMPGWLGTVTQAEAMRFMDGFTAYLMGNDIGVTSWAWWPNGTGIRLVVNGRKTVLGDLYHGLAMGD